MRAAGFCAINAAETGRPGSADPLSVHSYNPLARFAHVRSRHESAPRSPQHGHAGHARPLTGHRQTHEVESRLHARAARIGEVTDLQPGVPGSRLAPRQSEPT